MAISEIYIKLIVGFPKDPKVRSLAQFGADAGLARDLYVQMCLYCKDMLSDGFVPEYELGVLVWPLDLEHGKQLAKQLASVGLTKEASKDGASGWDVLAYLRRNGSREDVERLSKVRAEAGRTGGKAKPKRAGQRGRQASGKQVANQGADQNGSNTVSVSGSVKTTDPETEIQTPTESAEGLPPEDETPTQRANRLTRIYHDQRKLSNFPAASQIVLKAVKAGCNDTQIIDGLNKLIHENRGLTTETLRFAIYGPPKDSGNNNGQADQRGGARQKLASADKVGQMTPRMIV